MTSATVAPEDGSTDLWGTLVSDIQDDVSVSGKKITGTLMYLSEGQLVTDWGEGYFICLKFSNFTSGLTYENVKVGLSPTEGSGLVTLDSDQNGVFKVTNKDVQKLVVFQEKAGKGRLMEFYDLSGLTLD
jgi:hypothetical protein